MKYKAKGMHAATEGLESAVRDRGETVRTILPRGRRQSVRLLDAWDMVGPVIIDVKNDPLTNAGGIKVWLRRTHVKREV